MELDEEVRRSSHLYEPNPNVISMSQNELMNFESDARRSPFSGPTPDLMELERIAMRDFVREYGAVVHRAPKVVTKLYLSNLDETVTREHIQRLFSEAGELERCSVHYDQYGNSQGTAEVLFVVESDALAALGRWNNTMFCGKKLNIELVGTSLITHDPIEIHDLDHLPADI